MKRLLDLIERSCWTFAQAFAGAVVVTGKLDLLSLKIAAVAAVIAVLKGISIGATVAAGAAMAEQPTTTLRFSSATTSGGQS